MRPVFPVSFAANGALLAAAFAPCTTPPPVARWTADVFTGPGFAQTASVGTSVESTPLRLATASAVLDPTGTWLWAILASGGGELLRTADGSVVFTDPNAAFVYDSGPAGTFDAAGANLYYAGANGLQRIALAAPTAASTVPGCSTVLGLDPSGKHLLCQGPTDGGGGVFELLATAPGAQPTWTVSAGETVQTPRLTADGSSVVYFDDSDSSIHAFPVTGGTPTTIAPSPSTGFAVPGGSIVLDHTTGSLVAVDLAHGQATVTLPTDAQPVTALDGTVILYSTWSSTPPGVYVVPAP